MDVMQEMIDHRAELITAADSGKNRQEAWELFQKAIGKTLPWNTFKTYYKPVIETARANNIDGNVEVGHTEETDRLKAELETASIRIEILETEIQKLKEEAASRKKPEAEPAPKNFMGWTVRTDKNGYVRLYKSSRGKTISTYVGKTWNQDKAILAIQKAEGQS